MISRILTIIPSEGEQWGRYNLPRYIYISYPNSTPFLHPDGVFPDGYGPMGLFQHQESWDMGSSFFMIRSPALDTLQKNYMFIYDIPMTIPWYDIKC